MDVSKYKILDGGVASRLFLIQFSSFYDERLKMLTIQTKFRYKYISKPKKWYADLRVKKIPSFISYVSIG